MPDSVFTATIIASAPEIGCAVVVPHGRSWAAGLPVLGFLPYTDTRTGAHPYPGYVAGTDVVCRYATFRSTCVATIIGPLNMGMDPRLVSSGQRKWYNLERFTQSSEDAKMVWELLQKLMPGGKTAYVRNRSHVADSDMLPGDYDILDKETFVGLHVGRDVAQLRGSPLAYVDVTSTDRVRMVGCEVASATPCHEEVSKDDYHVSNTAFDISEAFGVKAGTGVLECDEKNETATPRHDDAIPLFRLQRMEGAPTGGIQDTVLDFPLDAGVHKAEASSEPPVLSIRRQAFTGDVTDASVMGIAAYKTPAIVTALQLGYGATPIDGALAPDDAGNLKRLDRMDDLREPYSPPQEEEKKEEEGPMERDIQGDDLVTEAALNRIIDSLFEGEYKQKVLDLMARRGFSKSSAEATLHAKMKAPSARLGGVAHDSQYPLTDAKVELKDPLTQESRTCYDTLSFITQEPDGSICIADGYGSEIRMCRGNIYISAALDIELRPGRDLHTMVPGDQTLNAQGRCDISSGRDSVSIRAVKDLKMAAGADDDDAKAHGDIVMENLSKKGGDILLKTSGSISALASTAINVGHAPGDSEACSLMVDAGAKGTVYTRGYAGTLDFNQCVVGGVGASDGSAIVVTQNQISLMTEQISAPANLLMQKVKDTPSMSVVRDGKKRDIRLKTAARGSLVMHGQLQTDGSIVANGLLKAQSVVAVAVNEIGYKLFKKVKIDDNGSVLSNAGAPVADAAERVAGHMYNKKYMEEKAFKFPETYNAPFKYVPGMRWQAMSVDSGKQGGFWNEPTVNGTAMFPGKGNWNKADGLSVVGYKLTQLNGGYVTNVKRN